MSERLTMGSAIPLERPDDARLIERLQIGALEVPAGGVLVVKYKGRLSPRQQERLKELCDWAFRDMPFKVVAVDDDIEFSVLTGVTPAGAAFDAAAHDAALRVQIERDPAIAKFGGRSSSAAPSPQPSPRRGEGVDTQGGGGNGA